ncbi:MAG: hypothetical protein ACOC33_03830 [bacterium]
MKIDHNEILYKVDWDILKSYINNNLIIANKHPDYDLYTLLYTPKVVSKNLWDLYTLSSNGLVIDSEGNVIGRPFKKIRNLEDYVCYEIPITEEFDVSEKLDGSQILLFYYKKFDEWLISSKKSFINDHTKQATKLFDVKLFNNLNKEDTYIFELIYPENKKIVNYGNIRKLVLIGCINSEFGIEQYQEDLKGYYSKYFKTVNKINIRTLKELNTLKTQNSENKEGVVVRFINGFRVKLLFDEYNELNSIISNINNIVIWEKLKNNYDFHKLDSKTSKDLYAQIRHIIDSLNHQYNDIEREALKEFINIFHNKNIKDRNEFAKEAIKSPNVHRKILFDLYDKKAYGDTIWELIKPEYNEILIKK